ncbi:MAG: hypothetical protein GF417_06190 [Candidatus Latescibacteria bacterium]|nr:hypothetical protein [bacterium]MBD3424008.1 hypothetical protein [Candidatus Latescibacterota bacterium]
MLIYQHHRFVQVINAGVLMNGTITIRDNYRELADIAIRRIGNFRNASPFIPVYILVRSNLVALQLKRIMADRLGGIFNLRFLTFPDLLDQMDRLKGSKTGKLPPEAGSLIVEKLKNEGKIPEYFREISARSGFNDSILRTIADLAEGGCDPDCVSELSRSSEYRSLHRRARAAVDIFCSFRRESVREGEDIHARFARAALSGKPLDGPLFAYGFYDFNELQIRLLTSIAGSGRVDLLMAAAEENRFPEPSLNRLMEAGFRLEDGNEPAGEHGRMEGILLETPDDEMEAREIVRIVLDAVREEGMLFRDIAIVFPTADCFPPIEEVLRESGIPHYLSAAQSPESNRYLRSVSLLLELLGGDAGRRELVEFLLLAPLSVPEGYSLGFDPFDLWVRSSAEAGVTGEGGWLEENRDLLKRLRRKEHSEENRRRIEATEIVGELLSAIFETGEKIRGQLTWKEISDRISGLAERIFSDDSEIGQIFGSGLEGCSTRLSFESFAEIFRRLMRRGDFSRGSFMGQGVNLLTLQQLRGLSFKMVFLAGLIDEKLPGRVQQDPFLKDGERELLNRISGGDLFLQEKMARYDEMELIFSLALRSASEKLVCSLALFEGGDDRKRIRSYLLDPYIGKTGNRYPVLQEIKLTGEETPETFISSDEYIYYQTIKFHREGEPLPSRFFLDRSLEALRGRMNTGEFSPWDGVFQAEEALGVLGEELEGMSFSATYLQSYARCPFAFFIRYLLGAETSEDPELKITVTPQEKGLLLHRILEKAYLIFRDRNLLPLRGKERNEISAVLSEVSGREFGFFSGREAVGLDFLWDLARDEIKESIAVCLRAETDEDGIYIPGEFEFRFGEEEPVRISLTGSGREIGIRGKIDRIDLGSDGTFRIIDYKSRIPSGARNNDFRCGEHIQLPIYLLGAASILGKALDDGIAEYREISTSAPRPVIFGGRELEENRKDFDRIIETITGYIRDGIFFADPTGNSCRWCDYKPACPASRERLFRDKVRSDRRCGRYLEIKKIKE